MNASNDGNDNYINVPEVYTRRQLNALYREIPLKDTTARTLRKYFNAMANLYGVIPLKKAYEIITEQSPTLVTKDEFFAFAEIARHEIEDYFIFGEDDIYCDAKDCSPFDREIVSAFLLIDSGDKDLDLYVNTKENQRGKPYYIPKKKELLLYDDPFYYEDTPVTAGLKDFLAKRLNISERKQRLAFSEIYIFTHQYFDSTAEIISRLQNLGVEFNGAKDMRDFMALYQDFSNNTRMQCNRGYTPNELAAIMPRSEMPQAITFGPNIRQAISSRELDADEMMNGILGLNMPNEALRNSLLKEIADAAKSKKIGRNDPCPCGSGKKYKKCCGR